MSYRPALVVYCLLFRNSIRGDFVNSNHRLAALAALSFLAFASRAASAAPVCHRLDVPGSTWTQLWQLNSAGQIAAGSDLGGFVYSGGAWLPLPAPPASSGFAAGDLNALGINDHGVIAGAGANAAIAETSFILRGSTWSFFTAPYGYPATEARALGNNGVVTGTNWDPANFTGTAFVYDPGAPVSGYASGFTQIVPTLSGQPAFMSIPGAMNDAGVFVGSSNFAGHGRWGFVYHPGGTTEVFRLNGLPTSARGINNAGTLMGFLRAPGDTHGAGLIWAGNTSSAQTYDCADLLGGAPDTGLYGESINDSGVLTGGYPDAAGNYHGVVIWPEVALPSSGFVYHTPESAGVPLFLGSPLTNGYRFATGAGGPSFATVILPIGVGSNLYTVIADGRVFTLPAGEKLDFGGNGFPGGVSGFKVFGVRPDGTVPRTPTAFVSEVSFGAGGTFDGTVVPLDVGGEIEDLQQTVRRLGHGLAEAMREVAEAYAEGEIAEACDGLDDFIQKVSRRGDDEGEHHSKRLPAAVLKAEAQAIQVDLGCKPAGEHKDQK